MAWGEATSGADERLGALWTAAHSPGMYEIVPSQGLLALA